MSHAIEGTRTKNQMPLTLVTYPSQLIEVNFQLLRINFKDILFLIKFVYKNEVADISRPVRFSKSEFCSHTLQYLPVPGFPPGL